jgi:iron complex outermembrane recepter protein
LTLKIQNTRERLLASSMICGVAFLALSSTQAAAAAAAAAADAANGEVSEVIVTGTRIPSPNLTSIAPVTTVGNADIKAQGVTRVEDIVNALPQVFAGQGSSITNGQTGTATVNLRGLGSGRTLVLIDNRRLMPGDPLSQQASADLNFVPAPLVERVDVLTGGASATYGADAVAGVVNFIMLKNFEGVRIDAQYSGYQHDNNNSAVSVLNAARAASQNPFEFPVPPAHSFEGEGSEVSLILGANSPDGKGNVTAYATYRQNNPILESQRDFSACTFATSAAGFSCSGSGTAFPASFLANGSATTFIVDPKTNILRPETAADTFNFGPANFFVRPDERYSFGAFAHYEIAPWAEAYMDTMFMDDRSTAQIASGGVFAAPFSFPCSNPLITPQEAGLLQSTSGASCAANPTGTFSGTVARRLLDNEGTGRLNNQRHTDYRIVTGLRGELGKNWTYDGYLQYGTVETNNSQSGNFDVTRIRQALNVIAGPGGVPVCAPGADPGCVPLNLFTAAPISPAALKFLSIQSFNSGNVSERVASLAFTGKLADYGIKSPMASEGVGVALGAEYRREHLDATSDFLSQNNLVSGNGGAALPINGGFDVYELFGEARVPLVSDMPFAKEIALELGYRFSTYSSVGNTNTYKVSGEWEVIDGLRFRAGYNRAVRAPNVQELFAPQVVQLDGNSDPCAVVNAKIPPTAATIAQCAKLFNLTVAQVNLIPANPANQYQGLTGGNPNLKPELSDTYTAGVVWQPTFVPGLNVSLDYYNIKVDQFIGRIGATLELNQCINTGNPAFCSLVHRDANGSLFLDPVNAFVQDTTLNTGSLSTKGIDVNVAYRTDLSALGLGDNGSLSASLVGTWLDTLITQPLPGGPSFDCKGLYGLVCGVPAPEWRHKARLTWSTPYSYGDWFKSLSLSAQWRYFGKVTLDALDSNPQLFNAGRAADLADNNFGAQNYIDLEASFTVHNNLNFRVGVNNVFDKDPPLTGTSCTSTFCNGNTFPQVYDALGRFVFVGLTADF